MDIVIASFNAHKISELAPLFPSHRLISPASLGHAALEIEENGADYFENALIKAEALYRLSGLPTLADDSGLSVAALGGAPGIHSARYGSTRERARLDAAERNALLLAEMEGVAERDCAFYCCLVAVYGKDRFLCVQETCPGLLAKAPKGSGGFGYDPLVYLPEQGRTMAELTPQEKNRISHRGRAARKMNAMLEALGGAL